MNIEKDDPRLTAYVLGELSGNEAAAMEEHLLTSEKSRETVEEIQGAGTLLQKAFASELSNEDFRLTPAQRSDIFLFPGKDLPEPTSVIISPPRWNRSAAMVACSAAAACVALATICLFTQGSGSDSGSSSVVKKEESTFWIEIILDDSYIASNTTKPVRSERPKFSPRYFDPDRVAQIAQAAVDEIAVLHDDVAVAETSSTEAPATDSPRWHKADRVVSQLIAGLVENPYLNPSQKGHETSPFAMKVGSRSYAAIQESLEHGKLPERSSVRIEEMVNAFSYNYAGPQKKGEAFGIHIESNDCPWAPGNRLVLVGLKGYEMDAEARTAIIAKDARACVLFNSDTVEAYRLIGYCSGDDTELMGAHSNQIKAGHQVTALYEVIPKGAFPPVFAMPLRGDQQGTREASAEPNQTAPTDEEMLEVQLVYQTPESNESITIIASHQDHLDTPWESTSADFRFASAVASYGMVLRSDTLLSPKDVLKLLPENLNDSQKAFTKLVSLGSAAE